MWVSVSNDNLVDYKLPVADTGKKYTTEPESGPTYRFKTTREAVYFRLRLTHLVEFARTQLRQRNFRPQEFGGHAIRNSLPFVGKMILRSELELRLAYSRIKWKSFLYIISGNETAENPKRDLPCLRLFGIRAFAVRSTRSLCSWTTLVSKKFMQFPGMDRQAAW